MFRLDYLSCFLTILATVLVGRKSWTGLLISIVNSLIVCVIGFRTSQFGFIPANLICICVYALNIRSWLKNTRPNRIRKHACRAASVPNGSVLGFRGLADSSRLAKSSSSSTLLRAAATRSDPERIATAPG